ncbi:MAG: hypothetical protein ACTHKT_02655 [Solirubrobacterales bacterium]
METLKMTNQMNSWNDDRLDELNSRVNDGFAKVDERFVRLEGEMKAGFAGIDKRFEKADERFATRAEMGEVKAQLNRLNDRFDRLIFVLIAACVGLIGTFLVAAVGLIVQS